MPEIFLNDVCSCAWLSVEGSKLEFVVQRTTINFIQLCSRFSDVHWVTTLSPRCHYPVDKPLDVTMVS